MNLLIVDDLATHRKLPRGTFEAAAGHEALQVLAFEKVDSAISTYMSPNDMKLEQTSGADKYRTTPAAGEVFKRYSQALINELTQKNDTLQEAVAVLQRAQNCIVKLNETTRRSTSKPGHPKRNYPSTTTTL